MTVLQTCPTEETLRGVLLGTHPGDDSDSVGEHVLHCRRCGAEAERIAAQDPLLSDLRAARNAEETPPDQFLVEEVVRRFRESEFAKSNPNHELGFLALPQPEFPSDLGTIDRYRLVELLGKGGMGMVFLAVDPQLNRRLALKVVLPKYADDPELRQRFLQEARATAAIRSPHVAEVYDCGVWNGIPYLTMELLDGSTLDKLPRPMPTDRWVGIAVEIAQGLADAHRHGVIHRDLKPSNIHLGTDARTGKQTLKLIDFGLARPLNQDTALTKTGQFVGTPSYMSPEQARGDGKADERTDLYSLGVILYQLASGRLPYDSAGGHLMGILTELGSPEPTPSVRKVVPTMPSPLVALVDRLLEKDPERRFAGANEVIQQLRGLARTEPEIHLSPAEPLAKSLAVGATTVLNDTPARRSRRTRWVIVAGMLMLAGAGVVLSGMLKDPQQPNFPEITVKPATTIQIGTHERRHRGGIRDLDIDLERNWAVTSAEDGVKVWDTKTLKLLHHVPASVLGTSLTGWVQFLGGDRVLVGSSYAIDLTKQGPESVIRIYRDPSSDWNARVSPDRKWIAMHSEQKTLRIWTVDEFLRDGKPTAMFEVKRKFVDTIADRNPSVFDTRGRRYAFPTPDGIQLYELRDGIWSSSTLIPVSAEETVAGLGFSPEADTILVSLVPKTGESQYESWSVSGTTPKRLGRIAGPTSARFDFLNASTVLGSYSWQVVKIDLDPLKVVWVHSGYGETDDHRSYRLLPGGELLTADFSLLRKYRFDDRPEPTELLPVASDNLTWFRQGHFARVKDRLLSVRRTRQANVIQVWSLAGDRAEKKLPENWTGGGDKSSVAALSFDGTLLAVRAGDDQPPVIWTYNEEKPRSFRTFGDAAKGHFPVAISEDNKWLLTTFSDAMYLWSMDKPNAPVWSDKHTVGAWIGPVWPTKGGFGFLQTRPGTGITQFESIITELDCSGEVPKAKSGPPIGSNAVPSVQGSRILSSKSPDGRRCRWILDTLDFDPKARAEIPYPADTRDEFGHHCIALSSDGRFVLAAAHRGRTIVLELASNNVVWDHHFGGGIWHAEFWDDKRLMVVHQDGVVELIEFPKKELEVKK